MFPATSIPAPRCAGKPHGGVTGRLLAALALLALAPGLARAEKAPNRGHVLKVPSSFGSGWVSERRRLLDHYLGAFEKERTRDAALGNYKLICDFNPGGQPAGCADFYACSALADYLLSLKNRGVLTVAYVHDEVTAHSVLPVLACSEIVLANKPLGSADRQRLPALGRVTLPGKPLPEKERDAYQKIVAARWSPVLIQKMYDADLVVLKARDGDAGPRYRDANAKPRPDGELVPALGPGTTALYAFAEAQEYGLCQKAALNDLNAVLGQYGLSSQPNLYDAPEQTIAGCVVIAGELNGDLAERTERRIRRALGAKVTLLLLQFECHGGDGAAAARLAQFLLNQNKDRDTPVHTVAYVTKQAGDTAAFLAFACDEVVFQPEAELSFEQYVKKHPAAEAALRERLVKIAEQGVHPPVLAAGMLDRTLRIHAVVSRGGNSRRTFLSEADYNADQASGQPEWESKEVVKPASANREDAEKYLSLTEDRARRLGIIADDGVAGTYDDLCRRQGLDPAEVRQFDSDWLDALADFLRNPWTSVVLVMIGITCLILELKMPGVGLPGVIAAVCFVLFFWAHSGFNQIGVLAMLLFALGLILIALEVFVLPGFGVPGVSGVLLVLVSLGLVAYGHWPRTSYEWAGFGRSLSPFGLSILGAVAGAYFLAKYLPHVPYANRLFLKPPGEAAEAEEELNDPAKAEAEALLGAIGVTVTPLRPAGKVQLQFRDQFVDVVAESGYLEPGTRVQVVEIEGNRVVVQEV